MPQKCDYCKTDRLDFKRENCPNCGAKYPPDMTATYQIAAALIYLYMRGVQ
jgi:hypothetical protein